MVADPAAAGQLVELCGGLPLALEIVAALLADEPDRPLADAIGELADETIRLQVSAGRASVRRRTAIS